MDNLIISASPTSYQSGRKMLYICLKPYTKIKFRLLKYLNAKIINRQLQFC